MKLTTVILVLMTFMVTSCKDINAINGDYDITMVGSNDYTAHDVSMTIEMGQENKISGKSACNQYFGTFKNPEDNQVEMGMMAGTKMYCKETAAVEKDYLNHLSLVTAVNKTKTGLDLLNKDGEVIIVAVKKQTK
ncbi:META domain-containing protein [uncultured Nonlabens sp.]|uniref:META domain-containing protein n=1 Tax=uncultured Nonlabens sp. TaxID=859306 RepID=UPI0026287E31|nr:META domain-containing protein [uncultured Nonlabens sp.]